MSDETPLAWAAAMEARLDQQIAAVEGHLQQQLADIREQLADTRAGIMARFDRLQEDVEARYLDAVRLEGRIRQMEDRREEGGS